MQNQTSVKNIQFADLWSIDWQDRPWKGSWCFGWNSSKTRRFRIICNNYSSQKCKGSFVPKGSFAQICWRYVFIGQKLVFPMPIIYFQVNWRWWWSGRLGHRQHHPWRLHGGALCPHPHQGDHNHLHSHQGDHYHYHCHLSPPLSLLNPHLISAHPTKNYHPSLNHHPQGNLDRMPWFKIIFFSQYKCVNVY